MQNIERDLTFLLVSYYNMYDKSNACMHIFALQNVLRHSIRHDSDIKKIELRLKIKTEETLRNMIPTLNNFFFFS